MGQAQGKEGETSTTSTGEDAKNEIHPSWNDEVLYTSKENHGKKVSKNEFELLAVIGKGSFAKVMQVKRKSDGQIFAMKVLRKDMIIARNQVTHTRAEKSILEKIQHPFIIKLHYAFQTKEKLYMIFDYINGGELFYHLKKEGKFSEKRVKFYAAELVCALSHLHSLNILYRDIKPENILIDSTGHLVLTDFGLSKEMENSVDGTHTFCGSPEYLAPEVLKGQGHGMAVDWWGLGIMIYEMLTGLPPFYHQNINTMYQKILVGELKFPPGMSEEAQSLISGLLTRDVEKRLGSGPSGSETIKNHPYFKGVNWEKLERKEIQPPFVPRVRSNTDTTNIDKEFISEEPTDSFAEFSLTDSMAKEDPFKDFSYQAPSMV